MSIFCIWYFCNIFLKPDMHCDVSQTAILHVWQGFLFYVEGGGEEVQNIPSFKKRLNLRKECWQNKIVTIILFLWGGGGQYLDETLDKQEDFRVGIELHWLVHWSSFYAAIHLKPYWRVQERGGAIRGTPPPWMI